MKPCMGGFCQRREKCSHYVSPSAKAAPAERLCAQGAELEMFFSPLRRANKPAPAKALEQEAA